MCFSRFCLKLLKKISPPKIKHICLYEGKMSSIVKITPTWNVLPTFLRKFTPAKITTFTVVQLLYNKNMDLFYCIFHCMWETSSPFECKFHYVAEIFSCCIINLPSQHLILDNLIYLNDVIRTSWNLPGIFTLRIVNLNRSPQKI